ncbi:VOC family protein [Rhizobium brockwellii]|uniref:VOC family protein n=1 Tax=Rhizobium brockwellii TaxID=3019932 RepID=UPI003F980C8F
MAITFGPLLLYAKNLGETARFYQILLGSGPKHSSEEVLIFDLAGQELIMIPDPPTLPANLEGLGVDKVRGKGIIIHFAVDDLDSEYQRLVDGNIAISAEPADMQFGRRQMYLYDCNGYNIVVEQRF